MDDPTNPHHISRHNQFSPVRDTQNNGPVRQDCAQVGNHVLHDIDQIAQFQAQAQLPDLNTCGIQQIIDHTTLNFDLAQGSHDPQINILRLYLSALLRPPREALKQTFESPLRHLQVPHHAGQG